ncbi:putative RNA helicase SDE3-like isoform X1 [Hibiscus syriacus]|uniref:RNA helicase SDE3-like isoform X1 n=1 Tax=Hibiscus syriacus TaxID=106335 RepID=A0A6A2XPF9_HIBSY|nr:non-specific lipid transfer protein GPI-anchored 19-like [Hibiscus syriacus]KAE8677663.1 putative RNA helicase SDE3-like isoform X1 [Hibiscus syriacus]
MELYKTCSRLVPLLVVAWTALLLAPVCAQSINTPCNPSVLGIGFTPCMNLLTNSSGNGSSPSAECCDSLKNLTSGGMDCLCLLLTGSVPFSLPINRTVDISLPRACNMPGVPVQCRTPAGVPVPAPGPSSFAPTLSPGASPTSAPTGSIVPEPTGSAESPESDTVPTLTPPSSTAGSLAPTATTGGRPALDPQSSAAGRSCSFSTSSLVLLTSGFVVLKYYH